MADEQTNIPNFSGSFSKLLEVLKLKIEMRQAGGGGLFGRPDPTRPTYASFGEAVEAVQARMGLDPDADDPVIEPYRDVQLPALRDAQEQALVQQLGAVLYDMAVRQTQGQAGTPGAVDRQQVEQIIEDLLGLPDASLFPFSYAIPYDERRSAFELTSANGVWLPYQGVAPITGVIDWNAVTSFDFLLRAANGLDHEVIFNAPAMKTYPRVIGIRREVPPNTVHVVSFETTGPTVFPGVNAPPFVNQTATILTGTGSVPLASQGANGDLFVRTDTGTVYVKINGLWLPRMFSLLDAQANTVRRVTGPPAAAFGAEGDAAVVVATGLWWQKTAAAIWTQRRTLKAPLNILPTPTYATIPVRRLTAFDRGTPSDIAPTVRDEYPLFLVLPSLAEGTQTFEQPGAGTDGVGYEELLAVTNLAPGELQPSQLPSNARGFQTTVAQAGRLYRVAAVTDFGQGPFSDPVRVT